MAIFVPLLVFALITGATYGLLTRRAQRSSFQQRLAQMLRPTMREAAQPGPAPPQTPDAPRLVKSVQDRLGRGARRRRFATQIPDTLLLIASALRAGHSPALAVQIVSEEMPPPISEEFAHAAGEIRLGLPASAALARMSERVRSTDWDLVVTAIAMQTQTGGNLAEILERISATIRERVRAEAETDALTAEGRLSASILVLLPPILALLLALRDPRYFHPLLATPLGHALIAGAIAGQIIGMLILRRMLRIEA